MITDILYFPKYTSEFWKVKFKKQSFLHQLYVIYWIISKYSKQLLTYLWKSFINTSYVSILTWANILCSQNFQEVFGGRKYHIRTNTTNVRNMSYKSPHHCHNYGEFRILRSSCRNTNSIQNISIYMQLKTIAIWKHCCHSLNNNYSYVSFRKLISHTVRFCKMPTYQLN